MLFSLIANGLYNGIILQVGIILAKADFQNNINLQGLLPGHDRIGSGLRSVVATLIGVEMCGDLCFSGFIHGDRPSGFIYGNYIRIAAEGYRSAGVRLHGQSIALIGVAIDPIRNFIRCKANGLVRRFDRQGQGGFCFLILAVRLGCGRDGRVAGAENGHFALGGNGSNLLFTACITYGDALQRGLLGKGEEEAAVPKHLGKPRLRESESAGVLFLQDIGGNLNGLVCAHRYIGQGIVLILLHLRNHQRVGGGVVHSFQRGCEGLVCLGGIDLFRILLIGQRDLRRYAIR